MFSSAQNLGLLNNSRKVHVIEEGSLFRRLRCNFEIIKHIILNRPNVTHFPLIQKRLIFVYVFLILFKRLLGITVVGTIASYIYAYKLYSGIGDKIIYNIFLMCSDIIDSLYPKTKLNRSFSITPCSFVDYSKFVPMLKEDIVVFLGRFSIRKNPILFLEAIDLLLKEKSESIGSWKFIMSGDGPLKNEIMNFVETKNLKNHVFVCKGDPTSLLGKSKIFVSIQDHENYPSQSLLEAIACENIIIATDVGDTKRLLGDSPCAKLIPPDKYALAEALLSAINDEKKISISVASFRDKIIREHNVERFAQYLDELWPYPSSRGNSD